AAAVGLYGVLCGVFFTIIHGQPERILVLGRGGALAGAAAGAMVLAFGSLFDGDLIDDLLRLGFRRKPDPVRKKNYRRGKSPSTPECFERAQPGLPWGERTQGDGAKAPWNETFSAN